METKKFAELVNESLSKEKLSNVVGGGGGPDEDLDDTDLEDGCVSGICSVQINPDYCAGGAVCTSGIAG